MSCFKKGLLSLAALSLSAGVFAGSDMETRVRELEKEMKQVRTETAAKTYGAYTVSARPDVQGKGFFFTFDVFYWQLGADGTEFAVTVPVNQSIDTRPFKGRVKENEFNNWDWGFRIGAGYNFTHGEWDIYANYTYYRNSSSLKKGNGLIGLPGLNTQVPAITFKDDHHPYNTTIDTAAASFKFNFDRLDLELGRDFYVAKYLSLRPHVGLVSAWTNQEQTCRYTGGDVLGNNTAAVKNKNKFWGIGPRAGMNTTWHLCNNITLIGNASGGLVYSNYRLSRDQSYSPNESYDFYLTNNFHRFTPTAQMQLGFGYDKYTSDCKQHFSTFLVWDIQYWWGMARKIHPTTFATDENNLNLQGITLGFKFNF